jgi:hypothetical protein
MKTVEEKRAMDSANAQARELLKRHVSPEHWFFWGTLARGLAELAAESVCDGQLEWAKAYAKEYKIADELRAYFHNLPCAASEVCDGK